VLEQHLKECSQTHFIAHESNLFPYEKLFKRTQTQFEFAPHPASWFFSQFHLDSSSNVRRTFELH